MASEDQLRRARNTFVHACRFESAVELIQLKNSFDGPGVQLIAPMLVLQAFSIELLLKSMLLIEGKEPAKVHELDKLFRKLHAQTQRRIEALWDLGPRHQLRSFAEQSGHPAELKQALAVCGAAFHQLRYASEWPDRPVFYLGKLPRLLQDDVMQRYPDWVVWLPRD